VLNFIWEENLGANKENGISAPLNDRNTLMRDLGH